ncbi:peptide MFS transporter [Sapientia aquatica]|nr:peptide MFS transporter [Sapientia aquatica]
MNTKAISTHPPILGHPEGLFFLFFTEMWERFSYYGMRSLLVLFLVSSAMKGGWGWDRADALNLYGSYTFWVYVTGILGGFLADKVLGARRAVVIGGFIISAGHICLTLDTHMTFYAGLALIVCGTGLFKPNISTIVGQLYGQGESEDIKRDAGYTLFYMGVNSGAFFGMALCGYIGEKISWNYGFGLAGFFMILGALQFYFAGSVFGDIGGAVNKDSPVAKTDPEEQAHVVRDRLIAIGVFSAVTVFFWMAFEQAGGSMTIFAADYTNRTLDGSAGFIFKIINTLLLIVPTMVLTWVLYTLVRQTIKRYPLSNLFIVICFVAVWALLIWMLEREFEADSAVVPATWFGILNSFFIIILAPLFSKLWQDYWQPSGPVKFGTGLILLGLGFGVLAFGASGIPSGAKTASVSMIWLVLAYLFHTMGELCVSPVGLSYISKLAPARLLGMMFGVWFIMTAIANKLAGMTGSLIDDISTTYSMSTFFLIFTLLPIGAGLGMMVINKWMLRKMHGVH